MKHEDSGLKKIPPTTLDTGTAWWDMGILRKTRSPSTTTLVGVETLANGTLKPISSRCVVIITGIKEAGHSKNIN
jgi:hypothetical protein